MRTALLTLALTLIASCTTPTRNEQTVDANQLIGTWQVDLRQNPGDPAYFQDFVVSSVNGASFAGTFYGSPVEQARINIDWGASKP